MLRGVVSFVNRASQVYSSPLSHFLPKTVEPCRVQVSLSRPILSLAVPLFLQRWATHIHDTMTPPSSGTSATNSGSYAFAGQSVHAESSDSLMPPSLADNWNGLLLAAPKKKVSHSRKAMRSANKGLKDQTNLVHCPACARPKLQHHLCEHCYGDLSRSLKQKPTSGSGA